MEPLLYNLGCAGFPFLEHSPGVYAFPTWSAFWLAVQRCFCFPTKVCIHALNQGGLHGFVTCAVIQGPTLRFGSILCGHSLEIPHNFTFEFVFCKQSLMIQQSMWVSRGDTLTAEHKDTHTHTHTYTHTHTHTHKHTHTHSSLWAQQAMC